MTANKITIKEVGVMAGVSFKTVSRVINNDPGVSDELRQRVLRVIEEVGYHPNYGARRIRARESGIIGLITDRIATTPYAGNIIKGAQETAWKHGYMLFTMNTDEDEDLQKLALATMIARGVDGLLFAAVHHRHLSQTQADAFKHPVPTALIDCSSPDPALASIVPDERRAGYEATRLLVQAGHRRIGLINGPAHFPAAVGRDQGYRMALKEGGLALEPDLVVAGGWWQRDGYDNCNRLLSHPSPPTALFCASDRIAMGAYDAIKERGLRIPEDIALVGFDNHEVIAAHLRPALTTMELPYYAMGRWGVERVVQVKKDPSLPVVFERAHCPIILRNSVSPVGGQVLD